MKAGFIANYVKLAPLYDTFMEGIDYEGWVKYIEDIVARFGGKVSKVADLACGTGNSTLPWALRGYRTWGIDLSAEMLHIARTKAKEKRLSIEFICQDLRCLHLGDFVDLAVCFQDGFNYLLELEDLEEAFKAVYRNLTPKGYFIFDLNYLPLLLSGSGEHAIVEEERYSLVWKSRFFEEKQIWEIEVKGQIKGPSGGENTFYEKHQERIYKTEEAWALLAAQNFTVLGTYQIYTFDPPHHQTPKIVIVSQKI